MNIKHRRPGSERRVKTINTVPIIPGSANPSRKKKGGGGERASPYLHVDLASRPGHLRERAEGWMKEGEWEGKEGSGHVSGSSGEGCKEEGRNEGTDILVYSSSLALHGDYLFYGGELNGACLLLLLLRDVAESAGGHVPGGRGGRATDGRVEGRGNDLVTGLTDC